MKGVSIHHLKNKISIKQLDDAVESGSFKRVEGSMPVNYGFKHHTCELDIDVIKQKKYYIEAIKNIDSKWKFIRAYINSQSFGDQTFIHPDTDYEAITVIFYVLDYLWNPDFGGKTDFFDDDKEPTMSVFPLRGRYLITDSRLLHVGNSPNRLFIGDRFTLALKFE